MAILGVDIDQTVVWSDLGWFDWLNQRSKDYFYQKSDFSLDNKCPYFIASLYPDVPEKVALDYWRQRDLYDQLEPIDGVVDVLKNIHNHGHEIVFTTQIKGDHHKSKINHFVKRCFPFADGFIATKEKKFTRMKVCVEDRLDNLSKIVSHSMKHGYTFYPVLFNTIYEQKDDSIYNNFDYSAIDKWNTNTFHLLNYLLRS